MRWLSEKFNKVRGTIGNTLETAGNALQDTAENALETVVETATDIAEDVAQTEAGQWIGERAYHAHKNAMAAAETVTVNFNAAVESTEAAFKHTQETIIKIKDDPIGIASTTLQNTQNDITMMVNFVQDNQDFIQQKAIQWAWNIEQKRAEFWQKSVEFGHNQTQYFLDNPGRAIALNYQGVQNGIAGLIGSFADGAITASYDWNPQRHLVNNAFNFVGLEEPLQECTWSCRDALTDDDSWTQWIKPVDEKDPNYIYEKVTLGYGQVTTEVGGGIALFTFTGGASSGSLVASGHRVLGLLGGIDAIDNFHESKAEENVRLAEEKADFQEKAAIAVAADINEEIDTEKEYLLNARISLNNEIEQLIKEFKTGNLSEAQHNAIADRYNDISKIGLPLIDRLENSNDLNGQDRDKALKQLETIIKPPKEDSPMKIQFTQNMAPSAPAQPIEAKPQNTPVLVGPTS